MREILRSDPKVRNDIGKIQRKWNELKPSKYGIEDDDINDD